MIRNFKRETVRILLFFVPVVIWILITQPTAAKHREVQQSASLLLGLEYLETEPIVVLGNSIIDYIQSADERIAAYPEDIAYMFPLQTNYPIKIRNQAEDDISTLANQYMAIGFIDANGGRRNFTARVLKDMFGVELRNDGNLSMSSQTTLSSKEMEDSVLIADASGNLRQYLRNSRFTLLVKNKKTGKVSRLRVHPNIVCREALNGVLTRNLNRLPLF